MIMEKTAAATNQDKKTFFNLRVSKCLTQIPQNLQIRRKVSQDFCVCDSDSPTCIRNNINGKYIFPNSINHFEFRNPDLLSQNLFKPYITVKYFIISYSTLVDHKRHLGTIQLTFLSLSSIILVVQQKIDCSCCKFLFIKVFVFKLLEL